VQGPSAIRRWRDGSRRGAAGSNPPFGRVPGGLAAWLGVACPLYPAIPTGPAALAHQLMGAKSHRPPHRPPTACRTCTWPGNHGNLMATSGRRIDARMRALTPGGSHLRLQVSPLIAPDLLIVPSPITSSSPSVVLTANDNADGEFQTSPQGCRLATTSRRNGFVSLRTNHSPPVALHPASRRRSYFWLPSLVLLGHGLSPC
jgi:hypothetical protein